jgi:hypothetical protein
MAFLAPCKPNNRAGRQRAIALTTGLVPDAATAIDRIRATYDLATESEHLDGESWYPAAGEIAELVGAIGGWSARQGAGIIAALSPQCSWDENIVRAIAYANGETVGATADSVRKCDAIAAGADPADVLGGRKVRSFFRNIVGIESAVTIDRHAVAIVYGRPLSDREIKILERAGSYTLIASYYRAAARQLEIAPSTLQAVTWLAWRRLKSDPDVGTF